LRAGVAAPQAPGHRRKEEQRQRGDHQNAGEVDEVLRVQHQPEDVEAAHPEVKHNGLTLAPLEPRQAIKNQLGEHHHAPAPVGEESGDAARVNLLVRSVEGDQHLVFWRCLRRCGVAFLRDDGDNFFDP